jgi:hypothetical protein
MQDFQNLRWSPDEKVFNDRFKELIQTYPASKKYIKLLESKKFKWAMFAQLHMFTAGTVSTQRSEVINRVSKKYTNVKCSLAQVVYEENEHI